MLFIALMSGPPRFRSRDQFASLTGQVDWSVMLSMAIYGIALLWLGHKVASLLLRRAGLSGVTTSHVLAMACVLGLAGSVLVSPAPLLTLYRVLQIGVLVLFGLFWVNTWGVGSTLGHLLFGHSAICVTIAACALVAPDLVFVGSRLRGDLIANTGATAAMGLVLLLACGASLGSVKRVTLSMLLVGLLALSLTRAAYAAALMIVLLAVVRWPNATALRRSLCVLFGAVIAIMLTGWLPDMIALMTRDSGSVESLSDRIPLWQHVLTRSLTESPWIGVGFYANREILTEYNRGLGTSHSAFVEILAGGGVVAFLPFMMMLAGLFRQAFRGFVRFGRQPEVFGAVSLVVVAVAIGLVSEEMVIASPTAFTFWISLSLIPAVLRDARRSEQDRGAGGRGRTRLSTSQTAAA